MLWSDKGDVNSSIKPYIENENEMTEHADALKILVLQLLLE